jgi:hypothetical protein
MLAVFARVDPALRKSITFENDTAFAQHALLRTIRAMTTWFCDAYASWLGYAASPPTALAHAKRIAALHIATSHSSSDFG